MVSLLTDFHALSLPHFPIMRSPPAFSTPAFSAPPFQSMLLNTDILQGSVATHFEVRWETGSFSDTVIANFILILAVKKFENW